MSNPSPIAEEAFLPDVFADELPSVDVMGPVARLTWVVTKRDLDSEGRQRRIVVAQIMVPTAILPAIAAIVINPTAKPAQKSAPEPAAFH